MGVYSEKAVGLFLEGFNCAQSVFGAFAPCFGIDQDTAMRLAASFGGGMGRLREVCGAVSGMLMIAGLKTGAVEGSDREQKAANYAEVQLLAERFREENGSIICADLLHLDRGVKEDTAPVPEERTKAYYEKRPCAELVRCAAEMIEERYFAGQG